MKSAPLLLPRPEARQAEPANGNRHGAAVLALVRRIVIFVLGMSVLLVGVVISVPLVPGPGFLVIPIGLAILATEFVWARRLLSSLKERLLKPSRPPRDA